MRVRAGFLAVVLSILALAARGAAAAPLAPAKASQVITAYARSTTPASPACPVFPNSYAVDTIGKGDGTARPFAIPPKSVFVVTSFDYQIVGASTSKQVQVFLVTVDPANPPTTELPAFALAGGMSDAQGSLFGTAQIPAGLVVESPALLCVVAPGATGVLVAVHGFFAKDS